MESGVSWHKFVQNNKAKRRKQRLEREREEQRKDIIVIEDEDPNVQKAVLVSLQAKALEDPTTRASWKRVTIDPEADDEEDDQSWGPWAVCEIIVGRIIDSVS